MSATNDLDLRMATAPQNDQEQPESLPVQEKTPEPPKPSRRLTNGVDSDAQEMVISSLRSQIQDLFSQVTQLNSKLVKSYDRVSDLEDDLHMASSNTRASSLKISQLELERTQHLSALNTGLLVEKAHVTAELTRLMEKATEEAAQRGQAETARADIEKDLDDLSATLFGQANTMVAEARYARALSDRKVEEAELALKSAEEAVSSMQQQMQALQAEKEDSETKVLEMQTVMGKGKWVARQNFGNPTRSIKLLSSHAPYQEFLLFIAHLRSVHLGAAQPPAMTTLLPLPFLARLVNEDSEPTTRLDLAPSLNWLSRRSVLSAIHNGQLTIEPVSSASLLNDPAYSTIPGLNSSNTNISCALCGAPIFPTSEPGSSRLSIHSVNHTPTNSWSTAIFKKPLSYSPTTASSNNPFTSARSKPLPPTQPHPQQVHIFRLASAPAPAISVIPIPTLPMSTSSFAASAQPPQHPQHQHHPHQLPPQSAQPATAYPLCSDGWCLMRLRATCTLWAFVRTGIVDKVWEEHIPKLPPPPTAPVLQSGGEKPPVPPRRRGLWGMASALGERAASWSDGDKEKKKAQTQKTLPPPPPVHPIVINSNSAPNPAPPPLPRRNETRGRPSKQPENAEPPAATAQPALASNSAPPVAISTPKTSLDASANSSNDSTVDANAPIPLPLRPTSPSSIPLPESRPGTPALPSRVASPVPAPATPTKLAHSIPVPGSPVTAATPPPPPLPRRAAARGSRLIPGSSDSGGSRPATPMAIGSALSRPTTPLAAPGVPAPVATSVAVIPTEGPTGDSATGPESTSKEADADADEKTDHAAVASPTEPVVNPTTPAAPESLPAADSIEGSATHAPETAVQINGTSDAEEKTALEKGSNELSADVNGGDGTARASVETATEGGADDESNGADADTNGSVHEYVGDAMWEERTWKEVVRLKEEMFWARIGGER